MVVICDFCKKEFWTTVVPKHALIASNFCSEKCWQYAALVSPKEEECQTPTVH